MKVTRRDFLRATGASVLLAGVPAGWTGGAYASDAPETPKVRIGIIALTDCSSIVMAHELGLFKKHGIESTISKEASWAVIRDRLTLGENQATHMLLGMPYASTMGLHGSPVKPMIIPLLPEPQRAGDHAHQGPARQGRQDAGADQAARARGEGQGRAA